MHGAFSQTWFSHSLLFEQGAFALSFECLSISTRKNTIIVCPLDFVNFFRHFFKYSLIVSPPLTPIIDRIQLKRSICLLILSKLFASFNLSRGSLRRCQQLLFCGTSLFVPTLFFGLSKFEVSVIINYLFFTNVPILQILSIVIQYFCCFVEYSV